MKNCILKSISTILAVFMLSSLLPTTISAEKPELYKVAEGVYAFASSTLDENFLADNAVDGL